MLKGLVIIVSALTVLGVLTPAHAVDLLVSSRNTDEILRYNGTTGDFVGAFVAAGSGGLSAPAGLAFGPDAELYMASIETNAVLRYDGGSGAFIDTFVSTGSQRHPAWRSALMAICMSPVARITVSCAITG